ncbi:unnamed protein product, partial [Mesorhabditis spiculigera]
MPSFRARCAICTLFYSLEDVHVIPCGHTFHNDCINTWLTSHHPHSQRCPVCRHRCGRHEVVKAFIDIDETAEGAAEHATDQLEHMRRELVLTKADALEAQRDLKRKVNDVRDEAARLLAKKDREVRSVNERLDKVTKELADVNKTVQKQAEQIKTLQKHADVDKSLQKQIDALVAQMKTVVQRRPPPPPQQQQPLSSKQPDVKAPEPQPRLARAPLPVAAALLNRRMPEKELRRSLRSASVVATARLTTKRPEPPRPAVAAGPAAKVIRQK